MSESAALLSAFVHGIAGGANLVVVLTLALSSLNRHIRIAAVLTGTSILAWLLIESQELSRALGDPPALYVLNHPVAGLFWLFVLTVFADWRVTLATLSPAIFLLVSGVAMRMAESPLFDLIWAGRNLFGALLAVHAGVLIMRGRRDDLVEGRRRFRALLLGLACLYVVILVAAAFVNRLDPAGPWLAVAAGRPYGGLILAVLNLSLALMALQVRPSVFGASRRVEAALDPRVEAAERLMIERLDAAMAAEAWRREGLTIGDLAAELELPEHRLRRLINQSLGHRNFADFVNGYRIQAAKRRLADPAEARTTVAAIAFDLGFGSLGPFNRAFRAATGSSPTAWRRDALASPELKEAG